MRNIYSKFSIKSFRLLSALFFLLGDLGISIYFYQRTKSDLSKVMENPLFMEMLNKSLSEKGVQLPAGLEGGILTLFTQAMMIFFALAVCFHIIIYIFYINEKRFSYLYLRMISTFGLLFCLFITISKLTVLPLASAGFLFLTIFYFFNFAGFFYFPITSKK